MRKWEWPLLALLLALFAGQALAGSTQKSASFDEQYHLTAGYSYLRTGDFRLATTHPPLAGMVAGLPLLLRDDVNLPLDHPLWEQANRYDFSDVFLWQANSDPHGLLVQARWGITALGVLLLAGLFFWARRLLGAAGGWLALLLAALDPNLVANSRIISTDLPLTAFFVLALWRLWCWLEGTTQGGGEETTQGGGEDATRRREEAKAQRGRGQEAKAQGAKAQGGRAAWLAWRPGYDLALAGVLGGLAMAAKYNGLLLWPVAGLVALLYAPAASSADSPGGSPAASPGGSPASSPASSPQAGGFRIAIRRAWGRLAGVAGAAAIGLLVLWAVYRFQWGAPQVLPVALPLPAPFFWDNLYTTFAGLVQETTVKPDFLLGQVSSGGWWYYFPVAIAVKTPLPLLILLPAGLAALVRKREARRQGALWLPVLAFVAMGLSGVLTIGYRHMLPAVPFAILLAANAADWLWVRQPAARATTSRKSPHLQEVYGVAPLRAAAIGALVLWLAWGTLSLHPHQEAHFNALAGPWTNWSNILVDSNLDWGQDLPALRRLLDERGIESVNLAYFGKGAPEAYGVRYRPLPGYLRFMGGREVLAYNPYTPAPGWYAISATSLRLGSLQPETTELYAPFRAMQPVDRAGYSIFLYRVDDPPGVQIVRPQVVDTPVHQVAPAELGIAPGVRAAVKWRQAGGSTLYAQGQGLALPADPAYRPVGAVLGAAPAGDPGGDGAGDPADGAGGAGDPAGGAGDPAGGAGDPPGVFTLLGYALSAEQATAGQGVEITLYWRVGELPMPQPAPTRGEPLSAFVHVVDGDPSRQVAQADGWEVALSGLEAGDVIAQRLPLEIAPEVAAGEYTLLAGLYSPQDWARLPVSQPGRPPADHILLGPLPVAPAP